MRNPGNEELITKRGNRRPGNVLFLLSWLPYKRIPAFLTYL
jgi:hypothetical protein